mmetsp:Transcript_5363/g.16814  ORF Transcript_5363/g.16814 Transcript_5363/m.16814 type:complete len:413 (+) Transcript_5363:1630-2868(+)
MQLATRAAALDRLRRYGTLARSAAPRARRRRVHLALEDAQQHLSDLGLVARVHERAVLELRQVEPERAASLLYGADRVGPACAKHCPVRPRAVGARAERAHVAQHRWRQRVAKLLDRFAALPVTLGLEALVNPIAGRGVHHVNLLWEERRRRRLDSIGCRLALRLVDDELQGEDAKQLGPLLERAEDKHLVQAMVDERVLERLHLGHLERVHLRLHRHVLLRWVRLRVALLPLPQLLRQERITIRGQPRGRELLDHIALAVHRDDQQLVVGDEPTLDRLVEPHRVAPPAHNVEMPFAAVHLLLAHRQRQRLALLVRAARTARAALLHHGHLGRRRHEQPLADGHIRVVQRQRALLGVDAARRHLMRLVEDREAERLWHLRLAAVPVVRVAQHDRRVVAHKQHAQLAFRRRLK